MSEEAIEEIGTILDSPQNKHIINIPLTTKTYQARHNLNTEETFVNENNAGISTFNYLYEEGAWDVCLAYHKGCFWVTGGNHYTEEAALKDLHERVAAFRGISAI